MNIQWRVGGGREGRIEVFPRGNRNKKVVQICRVADAPSRKIELSKSRAGIMSPPPFPFSAPFHFSFHNSRRFREMEVARLKRHFSKPCLSFFSPPRHCCAHKYLNKITIRRKEAGLIFKKAPPCIKDYGTTMGREWR